MQHRPPVHLYNKIHPHSDSHWHNVRKWKWMAISCDLNRKDRDLFLPSSLQTSVVQTHGASSHLGEWRTKVSILSDNQSMQSIYKMQPMLVRPAGAWCYSNWDNMLKRMEAPALLIKFVMCKAKPHISNTQISSSAHVTNIYNDTWLSWVCRVQLILVSLI